MFDSISSSGNGVKHVYSSFKEGVEKTKVKYTYFSFFTKVGDSIILATLFSITSIRGGWRSQIMRGDNSSKLNG